MPLQRITHAGAAPPTNLQSAISATAMSFNIVSSTGYPTGNGGPFVLDIDAGLPTEEKILCSSLSSNTVTVATSGRGWDGTTATAHNPGTAQAPNVSLIFSAAEADDANAHIYDTTRNDHPQYVLAGTGLTSLHLTGTLQVDGATTLNGVTNTGAINTGTVVASGQVQGATFAGNVVDAITSGTITPNINQCSELYINTNGAITIANPAGSVLDGMKLIIRIFSNGGPFAISWGSLYLSSGIATLPTTTTQGKTIHLGFINDSSRGIWPLLAADLTGY